MTFPPEGCSYRVTYLSGRKTQTATFADEFDLGRWFVHKELTGALDRTGAGLSIHCVTDAGEVPIDVMHPRLVRGRIERPLA